MSEKQDKSKKAEPDEKLKAKGKDALFRTMTADEWERLQDILVQEHEQQEEEEEEEEESLSFTDLPKQQGKRAAPPPTRSSHGSQRSLPSSNEFPRDRAQGAAANGPHEGTVLKGSYRLKQFMHEGKLGRMFVAEHVRFGGTYAIKVLHPWVVQDVEQIQSFVRAFRSMDRLHHPGIVRPFMLDQDDTARATFYFMEHINGMSLTQALAARNAAVEDAPPFTSVEILDFMEKLFEPLSYAHNKSAYCTNLHPSHILRTDDEALPVRVLNFGFPIQMPGKRPGSSDSLNDLYYTAPEMRDPAQPITAATDIFSLGVILYQMLTGVLPVGIAQPPSRVFQQQWAPAVDEVIGQATQANWQDRYQSVGALFDALKQALEAPASNRFRSVVTTAPSSAPKPRATRPPSFEETHTVGNNAPRGRSPSFEETSTVAPPGSRTGRHPKIGRRTTTQPQHVDHIGPGPAPSRPSSTSLPQADVPSPRARSTGSLPKLPRTPKGQTGSRPSIRQQEHTPGSQGAEYPPRPSNLTGSRPTIRQSNSPTGPRPPVQSTGSRPLINQTGSRPAINQTGSRPVVNQTGSRPTIRQPGEPSGPRPAIRPTRPPSPTGSRPAIQQRGNPPSGVRSASSSRHPGAPSRPPHSATGSNPLIPPGQRKMPPPTKPILNLDAHQQELTGLALSHDGKYLASAGQESNFKIWVTGSWSMMQNIAVPSQAIRHLQWSQNNRYVAFTSEDETLEVWDIQMGQRAHTFKTPSRILDLAWNPNGHHIYTAMEDGTIAIWHLALGRRSGELTGHEEPVRSLLFVPKEDWLLSGSQDEFINLWQVTQKKLQRQLTHTDGPAICMALDGAQSRLATGHPDGAIQLHAFPQGVTQRTIREHEEAIFSLYFEPSGKWLASASQDSTIRFWDPNTGRNKHTIAYHTRPVRFLVGHGPSHWLISAERGTKLSVWDVSGIA